MTIDISCVVVVIQLVIALITRIYQINELICSISGLLLSCINDWLNLTTKKMKLCVGTFGQSFQSSMLWSLGLTLGFILLYFVFILSCYLEKDTCFILFWTIWASFCAFGSKRLVSLSDDLSLAVKFYPKPSSTRRNKELFL
jgi:hypothetical protein